MEGKEFEDPRPRVACDVMLGKLAKWLRLLGFDTYYSNRATIGELVLIAKDDDRLLLTRGARVAAPAGEARILRLRSDSLKDQLVEVAPHLGIDPTRSPFSRCTLCNSVLGEASPGDLEGKVPDYVLGRIESFKLCPGCGKAYWPGSHSRNVHRLLEQVTRERPHRRQGSRRRPAS